MKIGHRKEFQSWRFLFLSDEGLTLETSDFKLLDLLLDSKSLLWQIFIINLVHKVKIILLYYPTSG